MIVAITVGCVSAVVFKAYIAVFQINTPVSGANIAVYRA
jgi:hypothetical protein